MNGRSAPGRTVMNSSTHQGPPKGARGQSAAHLEALLEILAEELVEEYLAEADSEGGGGGDGR